MMPPSVEVNRARSWGTPGSDLLDFCIVNGYRSGFFSTEIQGLTELLEAHLLIKLGKIF